jgi:hypothetical protein
MVMVGGLYALLVPGIWLLVRIAAKKPARWVEGCACEGSEEHSFVVHFIPRTSASVAYPLAK